MPATNAAERERESARGERAGAGVRTERLEPRLCAEQPGLGVGVAKGIDLPGPTRHRGGAEVLDQELVAAGGLVYHLGVERGRLVVHWNEKEGWKGRKGEGGGGRRR